MLIAKINKKVLRDTSLCVDLRDLKVAYLTSPHFRDIYLYLLQNRMPLRKGVAKWLDQNARNYLILDGLLFKILDDGEENLDTVLCIPTSKVHILLNAYHSSILGGHTGIKKVLPHYKSKVLLSLSGRKPKSIHNWMSCVPDA